MIVAAFKPRFVVVDAEEVARMARVVGRSRMQQGRVCEDDVAGFYRCDDFLGVRHLALLGGDADIASVRTGYHAQGTVFFRQILQVGYGVAGQRRHVFAVRWSIGPDVAVPPRRLADRLLFRHRWKAHKG